MEYSFLDGLDRALDRGAGGSEYSIGCLLSGELGRVAKQAHQAHPVADDSVNVRKRRPEWQPDWEPEWQVGAGGLSGLAPGTSACQYARLLGDEEHPPHTLRRVLQKRLSSQKARDTKRQEMAEMQQQLQQQAAAMQALEARLAASEAKNQTLASMLTAINSDDSSTPRFGQQQQQQQQAFSTARGGAAPHSPSAIGLSLASQPSTALLQQQQGLPHRRLSDTSAAAAAAAGRGGSAFTAQQVQLLSKLMGASVAHSSTSSGATAGKPSTAVAAAAAAAAVQVRGSSLCSAGSQLLDEATASKAAAAIANRLSGIPLSRLQQQLPPQGQQLVQQRSTQQPLSQQRQQLLQQQSTQQQQQGQKLLQQQRPPQQQQNLTQQLQQLLQQQQQQQQQRQRPGVSGLSPSPSTGAGQTAGSGMLACADDEVEEGEEGIGGLVDRLGSSSSDAAKQIQQHQLQLLMTTRKEDLRQAMQRVLLRKQQQQQQQQQELQSVSLPPAQLKALQQLPTSRGTAMAAAAAAPAAVPQLQALHAKFNRQQLLLQLQQQQQQQAQSNLGSSVGFSSSQGPLDIGPLLSPRQCAVSASGAAAAGDGAALATGSSDVWSMSNSRAASSSGVRLAAEPLSAPLGLAAVAGSNVQLSLPPLGPQHLAMSDLPAAAGSSDAWGRAPAPVALRQQQQQVQQQLQMQMQMQAVPLQQQLPQQQMLLQHNMLQPCQQQQQQGGGDLAFAVGGQLSFLEQQHGLASSGCNTPATTQGSAVVYQQQQQQQLNMVLQGLPGLQTAAAHSPVSTAAQPAQQQEQQLMHNVPQQQQQQQQQQASPGCALEGNCSSSICSTSGYGTASRPAPSPDCTDQQQPADSSDQIMAALLDGNTDW
uniref:BZIP domain-containing protein n=1 Tax=Tetradesmus obliquus TaxID=3088 RepID=A0A383V9C4_TETOB|eukprot:jgi/Sobl393_1/18167/SZX62185.1